MYIQSLNTLIGIDMLTLGYISSYQIRKYLNQTSSFCNLLPTRLISIDKEYSNTRDTNSRYSNKLLQKTNILWKLSFIDPGFVTGAN